MFKNTLTLDCNNFEIIRDNYNEYTHIKELTINFDSCYDSST